MSTRIRRDHYEVLGVARNATTVEVKAAYRRLALKWHPDRNPGDRQAEERFKELSLAYAVLGDEDKRAHYDRFGEVTADLPFGGGAGLDVQSATDFFDAIFGDLFGLGRKKSAGQDLRYTLELDFAEAALGCERSIRFTRQEDCGRCSGTGAEGGAAGLSPCKRCGGQGFTKTKAGFFSTRRECLACGGAGEVPRVRCAGCQGTGLCERERDYTVKVPAGSVQGSTQRVAGEGSPGRRGGPAGDLYVTVRVRPHEFFKEEAGLLVCELPVSPAEAALGAEVEVWLLDGAVRMRIPAGTQSGTLLRLRGKGVPRGPGLPRGDAHVKVVVETPVALTPEARGLMEKAEAALRPEAMPRRRAFRNMVASVTRPPVLDEAQGQDQDHDRDRQGKSR
jgi:molecular chaperone DnaJ